MTASNATSTFTDGIMVVGAIKADGNAASGFFAGTQPVGLTATEPGSNFGGCVDIWAPGDQMYSLWGYGPGVGPGGAAPSASNSTMGNLSYSGSQPSNYVAPNPPADNWSGYTGWAWLSGTSMAAPHVAAAAAYLASKYTLGSPIAIEQKLRDFSRGYGKVDALNTAIKVVHLDPP